MQPGYTINLGAPRAPQGPLFASVAATANALGNTEAVMRENDSGRTAIMTLQVLEAMDLCREFQPMEQHVQTVCRSLKGLQGQEAAVRNVLQNLVSRGLLVEAEAWLARLCERGSESPAPFRTVIIRTADRAASVRALLDSLQAYEAQWRPGHRYLLVDLSKDRSARTDNAAALQAFSAASGCRSLHFDRAQMAQRLRELQQALPEQAEAMAYLLDAERHSTGYHGAYGVGMNWASLLAAGERCALLDDDYLLPIRLHPDWQRGLKFGPQPAIDGLFASVDQALAQGVDCEQDPIALHAELCGHSLATLLGQRPLLTLGAQDLRGLAPSRLPQLRADARVIATSQGHRGDTGGMGLNWLLMQPPVVLEARLSDRDFYLGQVQRPALWSGGAHFQLVEHRSFASFMLDGARLLPPAPPVGRGEDALFSACLEALHPQALQMELPLAIGHRRPDVLDRRDVFSKPSTPAIAQLLVSQVRAWAPDMRGAGVRQRLNLLAAQLADLASMETRDARAYMDAYLLDHRANLIAGMQNALLQAPKPPVHWAADVRSQVEANGRALTSGDAPRFAEWPETLDIEQSASLFRGYLQPFAAALPAWADAFEWAKQQAPRWIEGR